MYINTKITNFIVTAFGLPTHVSAEIFDLTDNIDERNFTLVYECFAAYMMCEHEVDITHIDDSDEILTMMEQYWNSFITAAVELKFGD